MSQVPLNKAKLDWIVQCFVPANTGYMGDGFYRSKDPTNSIKVLKEKPLRASFSFLTNRLNTF